MGSPMLEEMINNTNSVKEKLTVFKRADTCLYNIIYPDIHRIVHNGVRDVIDISISFAIADSIFKEKKFQ